MLSTLPTVTGLPIGLRPQEHISSVSPTSPTWSFRALCIAIPHAREDESFADDLNMKRGIVSSRVALLLRSTEIQPAVSKIRALERIFSSLFNNASVSLETLASLLMLPSHRRPSLAGRWAYLLSMCANNAHTPPSMHLCANNAHPPPCMHLLMSS
jgi:hypothetical protein